MTGAHQETIRYKIKRQFAEQGFRFLADVDFRKLGLVLHWGRFVVSPVHYRSATKLFRSMNDSAYLIHFSKIVPQGHFVALFSLPEGTTNEFAQFLEGLKERKIISEFSLDRVLAQRHKTMDPTFFNFRRDRWEVDWEKVRRAPALPLVREGRAELLADYTDLLIINELQKDARYHISEVASKLKLNAKTVEYHYRAHVAGEGLMRGYMVRWMKELNEPLSSSVVSMRIEFEGLDARRLKMVQSVMNRMPYLWVEDLLEPQTYIATLAVPMSDFAPTMDYISSELGYLGKHADVGFLGVEESFNYTIPYHLFAERKWRFDAKRMEAAVMKAMNAGIGK
jgi:DNA-binding Lrp family transcriptional regulator